MLASFTPSLAAGLNATVLPAPVVSGPTVMILLDPETAHPRVLAHVQATGPQPGQIVLLWVVTPGELLTWGALAAEPATDRTPAMLAALYERMAAARRRLAPLQWACQRAGLPVQVQIVHGTVVAAIVKAARAEQVDRIVIPMHDGAVRGQPARPLADALARQVVCPVELVTPPLT